MGKLFEKVTESPEALADYLSTDGKYLNKGCDDCQSRDTCTGKESCKAAWLDILNSEV